MLTLYENLCVYLCSFDCEFIYKNRSLVDNFWLISIDYLHKNVINAICCTMRLFEFNIWEKDNQTFAITNE